MKETYNLDEAADYLVTSTSTVERLIALGEIPAGKIGKAYVIHLDDLRGYLRAEIARQTAERCEHARKIADGLMPPSERPAVKTAGGEAAARNGRRLKVPSLEVRV